MSTTAEYTLPETGFVRQKDLIGPKGARGIIPFSRTTLWRMVKDEMFPAPVRISPGAVGWRVEDVRAWIESRK